MRKPKQVRPLRLREYEAAITALKEQHPWLARQIVEPAPGHLAVVAHLFAQLEYLLPPTVLARKGSLSVSCNRDRLAIHYQPPRHHSERAAAVLDLIAQTKHLSLQNAPFAVYRLSGTASVRNAARNMTASKDCLPKKCAAAASSSSNRGYSRWCAIWAR